MLVSQMPQKRQLLEARSDVDVVRPRRQDASPEPVRAVTVLQPSGTELVFQIFKGDRIRVLKTKIAESLGISLDRFRLKLVSDGIIIEDDDTNVVQCQSQHFTLIVEKNTVIHTYGPKIAGENIKYEAGGVVGQDGCIYFAPCDAARVLRIAADGNVEQVGPEILGDYKYGIVGQDGCIYFAPRFAARVLRIAAGGN